MNEETIWLGPCPALEECVEVGEPDYARDAKAQCRVFLQAIRNVCGREPEGARLTVLSRDHDCGPCWEVAIVFDLDDEWATACAQKVDAEAPSTWQQGGVELPARRPNAR